MKEHKLVSRRQFLAAVGMGATSVMVAACAPTPAQPTAAPQATAASQATVAATEAAPQPTAAPQASGEVVFWYPWEEWGVLFQDEFNKADLGITARWEAGEYDENTKTMAALAAGTPPVISYLGRWQTCDLAVRNALVCLDEYVANAKTFAWENLWGLLQKVSIAWGKKWLIPYDTSTRALFYNKDLMAAAGLDPEKPPTTWDELRQMAIQITKRDESGRLDTIGFTPSFSNPPVYLMFLTVLWCYGGDMVNEDMTKITIASQEGQKAMTFLKGIMDDQGGYEEALAFTKNLSLPEGIDAFSAGKVGLALYGSWILPNYTRYAPDLNYGLTPGPVFPEHNITANYDGGGGWFFFKKGPNFPAAWQFLEFIMEKENQIRFCDAMAKIPSRSDAGEEWARLDEKSRRVFVSTADTVRWIPVFAGVLETLSHMASMFENVMIGGQDITSELEAAQQKMQLILDRHNSFAAPS